MTDDNSISTPTPNRFGFVLGSEVSDRRARIAAAMVDGEPFDGLTDREVASMINACVLAIMSMQTYRGRFVGQIRDVFDLAMYVVGNAMSDDALSVVDAIAEGKLDRDELQDLVSKHLDTVKQERDKDDRQRREAELAGNARILAGMIRPQRTVPNSQAKPSELEAGRA